MCFEQNDCQVIAGLEIDSTHDQLVSDHRDSSSVSKHIIVLGRRPSGNLVVLPCIDRIPLELVDTPTQNPIGAYAICGSLRGSRKDG